MILHDIANDADIVKVPSSSLCTERFLESDLDVGDVLTIPSGAEEGVCKTQYKDILDHFLAEVVIDAECLG